MVNRDGARRLARAGLLALGLLGWDAPARPAQADESRGAVRAALGRGDYPWYDAQTDDIHWTKVGEPRKPSPSTGPLAIGTNGSWSDLLVFGGFAAALIALVVLVFRHWKRYDPEGDDQTGPARPATAAGAGPALPSGLAGVSVDDPWAEANRRRLEGDLAGAVVSLFAHQLLSLARLGLIRLAPGRTGRQLLRGMADRDFQALLAPTLRQFEATFYGHRTPSPAEFAALWAAAEAFERRLAEGAAR